MEIHDPGNYWFAHTVHAVINPKNNLKSDLLKPMLIQDKTKFDTSAMASNKISPVNLTPHYKYQGQFRARQRNTNNRVTMSL